MLFIAYCVDKKDHLQVRLDTRPAHIAFLETKGDGLKLGGPTTEADGETPNGSLLIFEESYLQAAKEWISKEHYAAAGLFESGEVKPWKRGLGVGL